MLQTICFDVKRVENMFLRHAFWRPQPLSWGRPICTKPLLWRSLAIALTTRSSPSLAALYRLTFLTKCENFSFLVISVPIRRLVEFRGNANYSVFRFLHETTTLAPYSDRIYDPIISIFLGLLEMEFRNKVR